MPLLRGCCTLDLKIGTKIIGVICLIFSIIGFLAAAVVCIALAVLEPTIRESLLRSFPEHDGTLRFPGDRRYHDNRLSGTGFRDSGVFRDTFNDYDYEGEEKAREMAHYIADNLYIVKIVCLVILAQQFLEIIVSSCLIHGIRRNRRGLLVPWIAMHNLYVFIELGCIVLFITALVYLSSFYQIFLPLMAINLCWMALHIYFILVVISQYQALGLIRMHDEMSMK